ncbi:hypothetical protein UFOVP190_350 [uncultured Caudovirales phage]|uniref:Uncharacterized protein n=1 Tax=uncultured Caudovirales phage TaxID=2100421 RepID=A0A6J7WHK6_9CAUD|nr:hypothetical protein UFOVP190_350 [uncultured Caudovirales phage]
MATTPLLTIPVRNGNQPTISSAGAMRWNTSNMSMEFYNGHVWVPVAGLTDPKTWVEWFNRFINLASTIPDQYTKQVYLQTMMQDRFPGNYRVDLAGQDWVIVFDAPKDETWFNLKYT